MSADRRTKPQILEALAESNRELAEVRERLGAAEKKIANSTEPAPVPVAEAINRCVRAMDRLKDTNRGYGRNSEIENVIALLCDRYGVSRVETVTEPCARKHVEDLTASDVIGAIQGQVF